MTRKSEIELFRTKLTDRNMARNTITAYVADIRLYLASGLSPEAWLNSQRENVSPATLLRRASALRSFYRHVRHALVLGEWRAPATPAGYAHPLPGLMDDVERLIAAASGPDVAAVIALCGYCGLRVGEACSITPQNIAVRPTWLRVHGKGGKWRDVPLDRRALGLLSALDPDENGSYFARSDSLYRHEITKAGTAIGLDVSSHDLRMTFGTVMYSLTHDLRLVQELLGHASSKTTERYTGITDAAKEKAMSILAGSS